MKGHPGHKDLVNFVLGQDRPAYINEHIMSCDECAEKIEKIKMLLQPGDNSAVQPSDYLESRIISSYRKIKSGEKTHLKSDSPLLTGFLKPVLISAAALVLVISSILFYNYSEYFNYKPVPLALKNIEGTVKLDNTAVDAVKLTDRDGRISTGEKSSARLYYSNIFSLRLAENTVVEIKKSLANKNRPGYRLEFDLTEGALFADFSHLEKRAHKMEYRFNTSQAVVHSIGTKFFLEAAGNKTRLFLKEGSVVIEHPGTGKELRGCAGKKYTMDEDLHTEDIDADDNRYIDSIIYKAKSEAPEKVKTKGESVTGEKSIKEKSIKEKTPGKNRHTQEKMKSESRSLKKELRETKKEMKSGRKMKKGMR